MGSPSKFLDFAVADLVQLFLEARVEVGLVVVLAGVVFGQAVGVTEDIAALALDAQQPRLLAAVEASLAVLLLRLLLHFGFFGRRLDGGDLVNRHLAFGLDFFGVGLLVAFGAVAAELAVGEECLAFLALGHLGLGGSLFHAIKNMSNHIPTPHLYYALPILDNVYYYSRVPHTPLVLFPSPEPLPFFQSSLSTLYF